ncbi:TraB/GumN family protein [Paremcibacter congregatus]|uniref:TraB/GumN family protein n=1 Tax=Paremcibacter congregatus TaxID=2043170 RepID=UPI003A8EFC41
MILHVIGALSRRLFLKTSGAILTGLLLLSVPVGANETTSVKATPALWVVEKGDAKTYLMGSFHLLPKNYDWYHGPVRTSFEAADEMVMETVLDQAGMAAVQAIVMRNSSFTDADTLKNHLDDAHYQKMLGFSKAMMGLDEATAQKMKPWFMAINLSVLSIMSSGMDPNSGVDKILEARARSRQIAVTGLETPTEQMSALIHHPLPVQAAMLTDTLDKLDDFKSYIDLYLSAWASGDNDKIAEAMVEDMEKYEAMYQALLVQRNKNWMPGIEGYLGNGKTSFIVVGAAHLVGKDGIVKMLRDKGYNVVKLQ